MKLKKSPNRKRAEALVRSERGKYLLSQALHVAADTLTDHPNPPWSNVADMLLLRDEIFPLHNLAIGRGCKGTVRRPRREPKTMSPSGKSKMIEAWRSKEMRGE